MGEIKNMAPLSLPLSMESFILGPTFWRFRSCGAGETPCFQQTYGNRVRAWIVEPKIGPFCQAGGTFMPEFSQSNSARKGRKLLLNSRE